MKRNTLVQISRIILSFLFVFGAVSKLVSMPFFDGMVAELLLGKDYFDKPSGMFWIQLLTRVLVAAELVIGIALLQKKWFKKLVLPATMGMLVLFTIHLFYEGFSQVNGFTEGNCGCFGDVLPMTNLESIIKNVIGMIAGIYLWLKFKDKDKFASWVGPAFLGLITLFTLSFGIKSYKTTEVPVVEELGIVPVQKESVFDSIADAVEKPQEVTQEVAKTPEPKNEPAANKVETKDPVTSPVVESKPAILSPSEKTLGLLKRYAPAILEQNLDNSTKLVCLFSMTCSHCQEVYRDLSAMKASGKLPSLFLVNYGTEYEQNYFFTQVVRLCHCSCYQGYFRTKGVTSRP